MAMEWQTREEIAPSSDIPSETHDEDERASAAQAASASQVVSVAQAALTDMAAPVGPTASAA